MLIVHGNIKTMAERDFADGYIEIRDGKIAALGEMKDCPQTKGRVLDVEGSLVMPGIIEAHCHMGITEEKKGMEGDDCNENVNPITPYLRAIDAINPMDAAFRDAMQAGITSAMIGPGSANVVGGQFAFVKTHGRCIDDMIVRAPAAMKVAFGENPKVNYSGQGVSPSTRMAIAALLREELTKAEAYRRKREKNQEDEKDFRYECWLPVLRGEIPLKAHAHRADDILTAVRIAKEFGLRCVIVHGTEGHLIAEFLAKEGVPVITGPFLTDRCKPELARLTMENTAILARAGVQVAICTDHPETPIALLPFCAAMAARAGMDEEEALAAITINAACICGAGDRLGSLSPGKDADLVVMDGHPFHWRTRVTHVLIDGQEVI